MTHHDQFPGKPNPVPGMIMIVEDDPGARDAMQGYLRFCGYDVYCCACADDAIRFAVTDPPAVVICDWQLGGGEDGVTVAEVLQARFGTRVILVTGHCLDHLRRHAERVQVASFLRKPVDLNALADAVSRQFRH